MAKVAAEGALYGQQEDDSLPGSPMRPLEPRMLYGAGVQGDGPVFCANHATSAQRTKIPEGAMRECSGCKSSMSTNYETFTYCPPCSCRLGLCMICGAPAAGGAAANGQSVP